MRPCLRALTFLICLIFINTGNVSIAALKPEHLLLVVNSSHPDSLQLAHYYARQRGVPAEQILKVHMPGGEDCSRQEFDTQLLKPLRARLDRQGEDIRALLLFYGLPLRVSGPEPDSEQKKEISQIKQQRDKQKHQGRQIDPELKRRIDRLSGRSSLAAIDSELALARIGEYRLDGWQVNPLFARARVAQTAVGFNPAALLMVSRLDGPDVQTVRRMIDDSLYAERYGLTGKAYFDARWPLPDGQRLSGYAYYDASLHRAAALTEQISSLGVVLDQQQSLFAPGSAPDAALYTGWYSLGRYVDAFDWNRGAVAYHIASSECVTLNSNEQRGWCQGLLEDGVAATIGPVAEPYIQGFPVPELFVHYLLDGHYSLVEGYMHSLPYLSWQMILIGDPLYRPFRLR